MDTDELIKKMNVTMIRNEELEQIRKDRLDFGFDSIYFRYASVIDELAKYKLFEQDHYKDKQYWDKWADNQKMHFYMILEQLVHAHE